MTIIAGIVDSFHSAYYAGNGCASDAARITLSDTPQELIELANQIVTYQSELAATNRHAL
jgi:hypothetical protein